MATTIISGPNSLGNQASQFHIFHSHDNFKSSCFEPRRSLLIVSAYNGLVIFSFGPQLHSAERKRLAEVASLGEISRRMNFKMLEGFVCEKNF